MGINFLAAFQSYSMQSDRFDQEVFLSFDPMSPISSDFASTLVLITMSTSELITMFTKIRSQIFHVGSTLRNPEQWYANVATTTQNRVRSKESEPARMLTKSA